MLSSTIDDLSALAGGLKSAADLADEEGDAATSDVLTGQIEDLQKQIWMLKSTLA
jgi:starvation-inducible DNA-binding protein